MISSILNIAIPTLLGVLCIGFSKTQKKISYLVAWYMFYTSLGEAIGLLLSTYSTYANNIVFYDKFLIPSQYLLQFIFFAYVLKNQLLKKLVFLMSAVYFISFLIEKFVMHYSHLEVSYFSYCIGSIVVIVCSLFYLYSLVNSPSILRFKSDMIFWIAIGSLFFQLFTFPFWALMDVWNAYPEKGNLYSKFGQFCIYVTYGFYTIGILCWKRK